MFVLVTGVQTCALPICLSRVYFDRSSKRPRGRLEDAFDDVVVVAPVERLDVQGYSRRLREGLEPVLEQFGLEIAEALLADLRLPHGERPPGHVQPAPAQRPVPRHIRGAGAGSALAVPP